MLIYTHPLLLNVVNVQNLLELHSIKTKLRNEFASGATGDLAPGETWVELWLEDERDEQRAKAHVEKLKHQQDEVWYCNECGEENTGAFEFCWQCQAEQN